MEWDDIRKAKGKIPIGSRVLSGPNQLGFCYFYGFTHARNIGTIIEQDKVAEHVREVENQPRMIAKAVEWIEDRKDDRPFFLYFPMCPPHTPVVPAPEFAGKSGAEDQVNNDPKYGDWVYQGDHMLGRILDALERKGLAAARFKKEHCRRRAPRSFPSPLARKNQTRFGIRPDHLPERPARHHRRYRRRETSRQRR